MSWPPSMGMKRAKAGKRTWVAGSWRSNYDFPVVITSSLESVLDSFFFLVPCSWFPSPVRYDQIWSRWIHRPQCFSMTMNSLDSRDTRIMWHCVNTVWANNLSWSDLLEAFLCLCELYWTKDVPVSSGYLGTRSTILPSLPPSLNRPSHTPCQMACPRQPFQDE